MPRKGMRSLCFSPETPLFQGSVSPSSSITSPASGFSESMIEQIIDTAAIIVAKWDGETSPYAKVTSMFYESKREAMHFIRSVNDLRKIMHFLVSGQDSGSENLIRAQRLMQIAMKRLQKEFYQIFIDEPGSFGSGIDFHSIIIDIHAIKD